MRNFKFLLIAILLITTINSIHAQDENNKWALGFGINAVDVSSPGFSDLGGMISDYFGTEDWNMVPAISMISVSRYMNNGFSVKLLGSLNKINSIKEKDDVNGLSFFSIDAAAVYDLNSLFGETGWFDPHIQAGMGSFFVDGNAAFSLHGGWGFNSWFNENIGLSFDSTYNYANSGFNGDKNVGGYFQHSLGLIIRFNGDE